MTFTGSRVNCDDVFPDSAPMWANYAAMYDIDDLTIAMSVGDSLVFMFDPTLGTEDQAELAKAWVLMVASGTAIFEIFRDWNIDYASGYGTGADNWYANPPITSRPWVPIGSVSMNSSAMQTKWAVIADPLATSIRGSNDALMIKLTCTSGSAQVDYVGYQQESATSGYFYDQRVWSDWRDGDRIAVPLVDGRASGSSGTLPHLEAHAEFDINAETTFNAATAQGLYEQADSATAGLDPGNGGWNPNRMYSGTKSEMYFDSWTPLFTSVGITHYTAYLRRELWSLTGNYGAELRPTPLAMTANDPNDVQMLHRAGGYTYEVARTTQHLDSAQIWITNASYVNPATQLQGGGSYAHTSEEAGEAHVYALAPSRRWQPSSGNDENPAANYLYPYTDVRAPVNSYPALGYKVYSPYPGGYPTYEPNPDMHTTIVGAIESGMTWLQPEVYDNPLVTIPEIVAAPDAGHVSIPVSPSMFDSDNVINLSVAFPSDLAQVAPSGYYDTDAARHIILTFAGTIDITYPRWRFQYFVPADGSGPSALPNLTGAVGPERVRFYRPETHNIRP